MNHILSLRLSVVLALAALLMNVLTALAYPANTPETSPDTPLIIQTPCYEVLGAAPEVIAEIDIPSRRAEYAALERISDCVYAAGDITIPVTGRATWATSQYLKMKDRQAEERMDP